MVLMSKLRLSQDQIKAALSELAAGRTVREVSRAHGISPKTLCRWRAKLSNEQQSDEKKQLYWLEAENRRLKRAFAELTLDYVTLRAALIKDVMGDC